LDPRQGRYRIIWNAVEDFFSAAFAIELAIHMYGVGIRLFWRSAWNVFDIFVVLIGALDFARVPMPGPLRMLRMVRVFRVFRLFGRVESLRKIVCALRCALPGVVNAFGINLLMMCIYAVLAVEFFRHISDDCEEHPEEVLALTPRHKCFGADYFGNFALSLYTLFQVLTGDSWSEAVVRPILYNSEASVWQAAGVSLFFCSFILVNAVVLLNVVVALLLDGMSQGLGEKEDVCEDESLKLPKDDMAALRAEVADLRERLDTMSLDMKQQLEAIFDALQSKNVENDAGRDTATNCAHGTPTVRAQLQANCCPLLRALPPCSPASARGLESIPAESVHAWPGFEAKGTSGRTVG